MNPKVPDFRSLSVAERIQLVEDIWDSIATEDPESVELSEEQRQELRRRLEDHRQNPDSSIPWEAVRAALFQPRQG